MAAARRHAAQSTVCNEVPDLPDSVAHSLLFELPREIRDRIYALCLTSTSDLPVEWPRPRGGPIRYEIQAQLLRICRIVHDEAAPLLYTLTNLTFHHPSDANMFVHAFTSAHGRKIANLNIQIKSQDTRMWMPYLTSTDEVRSLRADFPNLRDISVHFRSSRWQHQNSAEVNLQSWSVDSRLDEVIDGLRRVLLPGTPPERKQGGALGLQEFQDYVSRAGENALLKKRLMEMHKARPSNASHRPEFPLVRVCCACRVHSQHFETLTGTGEARESNQPNSYADRRLPLPVKDGEPFRGFTAADFRHGVKTLYDGDSGVTQVTRTSFANKKGVLLALEIHCLDPKHDAAEQAT